MLPASATRLLASLVDEAYGFGIELDNDQIEQFAAFTELLLQWSARLSLTGAQTADAIIGEHIVDALSVAAMISNRTRVADLGSGAGFPGIPVAICRPDATVILVESRRKR